MHAITSLFGGLALLALVLAGFVLMFSPALGRQLLKNVGVAIVLYVLGSMLLSVLFSSPGR